MKSKPPASFDTFDAGGREIEWNVLLGWCTTMQHGECPRVVQHARTVRSVCKCRCHTEPPPSKIDSTDDEADKTSVRPPAREDDTMTNVVETETAAPAAAAKAPATAAAAGRKLKADPIRDAIERDGKVEVTLKDPADAAEKKRVTNTIFGRAYTLGLKGQFEVKVVDGVVIGQRKTG